MSEITQAFDVSGRKARVRLLPVSERAYLFLVKTEEYDLSVYVSRPQAEAMIKLASAWVLPGRYSRVETCEALEVANGTFN